MVKKENKINQFCRDYLAKKELFRWFIIRYYGPQKYLELWELAEQNEEELLRNELNEIWDDLPDSIFNLRVAPPGWETFITLIEK